MKKLTLLFACLLLTAAAFPQSQQGFVRTLGRPDKKGEALGGVTIRIKGQHNPVLSNADGTFSFTLPDLKNGDAYTLQQVKKNGYELNDSDLIGRQQAFSDKVRLEIVMVSLEQLQAEKQRIEDKAFATAQRNYQSKADELEQQLAANKISSEKYNEAIKDLVDKYEKYQSLIDGLAEHYAHTDYDLLDEKDREINLCIENGELERADSLIRLLFNPLDALQRNKRALADLDRQIGQARGIIEKANADMASVLKQQNKDAEYLYQLYTIALARFDFDKAGSYIETRAELDSTQWKWQFDAGDFCKQQNLFNKAERYLSRTFNILTELTDNFLDSDHDGADTASFVEGFAWMNYYELTRLQLAHIHAQTQRVEKSIGAMQESSEFFQDMIDAISDAPDDLKADFELMNAAAKSAQAISHMQMGQYAKSEALQLEALKTYRRIAASQPKNHMAKAGAAENLTNLGLLYKKWKKYDKSKACFQEGIAIWRNLAQIDQEYEAGLAPALDNLGSLYQETKDYTQSEAAFLESLEIYRRLTKSDRNKYEPKLSISTYNLAHLFAETNRFSESEKLYLESLEIRRRWAKKQPEAYEQSLALVLGSFGSLYYNAKDYAKCEPLYLESYQIYQRLAKKEPSIYNPKLAVAKFNLAIEYYHTGKIPESVTLWIEVYEMFQQLSQKEPSLYNDELKTTKGNLEELAPWLESEAIDYRDNGQYEKSETYYLKALDLYRLLAKENPTQYEPEIAGTLNSIGILYIKTKRFPECESAFKESLAVYERLAKTNLETYQSEVVRMKNNLSALAYQLRKNVSQDKDGKHYMENEALLTQAVEIYRFLAKNSSNDYKSEIAATLGSLSYNCLFNSHWKEAEQAAREGLDHAPAEHWINTNLAPALLFQGKHDEAEAIYRQYKDELKASFLQDINDFESANIVPEQCKADVEQIKKLLTE